MPQKSKDVLERARSINQVTLRGRLSKLPQQVALPSGDEVWTFRVILDRHEPIAGARRQVDAIDCAVWSARLRRSVERWLPGDEVEIQGHLRRRFYRAGAVTLSRTEVEVTAARLIRRAGT